MLCLEESVKTRAISITLRPKERFFNSIFCIALTWAIFIHALGIVFFYIAPFKLSYEDSVFPPVAVASDIGRLGDGSASASVEEEIAVPTYLLLPSFHDLSSPSLNLQVPVKNLDYRVDMQMTDHSFLAEELKFLNTMEIPLDLATYPPLKVVVSGRLAHYPWSQNSLQETILSFKSQLNENVQLSYSVKVEGLSGQIVWFQPKQALKPHFARLGEILLRQLRFDNIDDPLLVSGQVEILISAYAKGESS